MGRFFIFIILLIFGVPVGMTIYERFPPDVGKPSESLTDNLKMHRLGKFSGASTAPDTKTFNAYFSQRDKVADEVLGPAPGRRYALCDVTQRIKFRSAVESYAAAKVRTINSAAEKNGEATARLVELSWIDAKARNAEAAIIDAFSVGHLILDDFGRYARIEARRLASRAKPRTSGC